MNASDNKLTTANVRAALGRVVDPCSIATGAPISIPDMGLVKDISISNGCVKVVLQLTSPWCFQVDIIIEAVKARVAELEGVDEVQCEIDSAAEWTPDMIAPSARAALRRIRPLSSGSV